MAKQTKNPTVNVIGLGYIGLPTAATLAGTGLQVTGIDINQRIVDTINSGNIHISETGLAVLVKRVIKRGKLVATSQITPADIHIIAVPTPIDSNKRADLTYVKEAAKSIAQVLKPGDLVILESTVPPATCTNVIGPIIKELAGLDHLHDYYLSHCPERVIPGKILQELKNNDRIIGGTTPKATQKSAELYARFVKADLLKTDATTAEMCKLMENTYRDVNIALANELSNIADDFEIDIHEAIKLANHHPRVNIHTPSIGVGGHCIPVDPWFIVDNAKAKTPLIKAARQINDQRPKLYAQKIIEYAKSNMLETIALLGLSYKPDVDDLRESPAIEIVKEVSDNFDGKILIVEPHIDDLPLELIQFDLQLVDLAVALAQADKLMILVPHSTFKSFAKKEIIINVMDMAIIDTPTLLTV